MQRWTRNTVWDVAVGTLLSVAVAAAQTTVTGPGPMLVGTTNSTNLILQTNNTNQVWLTPAGNLGIGIATPTERLHVAGNALITGNGTISGDLSVGGNTTLGDAATDVVTITAATVNAANLPTGAGDDFVIRVGGQLRIRTVSNIVTGTGTPNRLVRWITSSTIGNGSLDDDGNGTLSRSGPIAINPGAGNTLSTNGNLSVAGNATIGGNGTVVGNLSVDGNTTLGNAAADVVTINAATVTAANLPTATTGDAFVIRDGANQLRVRTVSNIVTGTGTPNRLVRWTGANTIGDGSLDDNGAGVLSRAGNIAINPGTTNTLSTNGSLSVGVNLSVGGNTTLGDAAADAVTINAATVTAANLPTTTTGNDFVVRVGGQLQVRTLAGIVTGTGDPGQVAFWTGPNALGGSPNFVWTGTALQVTGNISATGNVSAAQLQGQLQYKVTAGAGLTGGTFNNTADATFAVNVDGTTLSINPGGQVVANNTSAIWNANQLCSTPLNCSAIAALTAADRRVLTWNGSSWVPWGIVDDGVTTTVTISPPNFVVSANNNAAIWNANRLQGRAVSSAAPSSGNVLVWNGTTLQWEPQSVTVAGAWSVNGNPGTNPALNFLGTTDDQPLIIKTDGVERMRVANSTYNGYVGIGDTDPAFRLELPNFANPNGRGRANSWQVYSSIRWKEEIRPIENALDKVLRLRGYYFRWKPEYGGTEDIGFIAEEVAGVVPEIVSYEPDGQVGGMDYSRLVALLVEAMKQQQQEIAQLRGLVEQLLQERGSRGGEMGGGVQIHDAWLGQNIPNPFEGTTTIPYYIPAGVGRAELVVRDRTGRELRRVELPERGTHGQVTLEMRLLGAGVYEYSLVLDGRVVATKQMTLLR